MLTERIGGNTLKKRIISVLCLLLMACTLLAACGKEKAEAIESDLTKSKYLGTWDAVSMSFADSTDPFEEECYLTLNPDGTAVFYTVDGAASCTWVETAKGLILLDDADMVFTDAGDAITMKTIGVTIRFEKR